MTALPYPQPLLTNQVNARPLWPGALAVLIPLGLACAAADLFAGAIAAGLLYTIAVLAISFWRPYVALMLAFALAPFVSELPIPGPVHVSIGEFTLALCLPSFFITAASRIRFPTFLFFTLLYLAACLFTTIANADRDALTPFVQMVLYLIVSVLVYSSFIRVPSKFIFILDGALAVSTTLALISFTPLLEKVGLHKNSLGASMASAFLIAVECWFASEGYRKRRLRLAIMTCILAAGLLFSLSRGSWMAALSGLVVLMAMRRQFKTLLKMMIVLVPMLVLLFFTLPEEQQDYALSADSSRENIRLRLVVIDEAERVFNESPIYGVGISFRKNIDATNLVLISLAESGIVGLGTFALMHAAILASVWKTQKKIPRSHPLYSPVALGGALVIGHLTHGLVDHYWSRGPILQAWAAAGMSTGVYYALRAKKRRPRGGRLKGVEPSPAMPGTSESVPA